MRCSGLCQLVSRCRRNPENRSPLWWSPVWYRGSASIEVELSTNPLKWCEVTCTFQAFVKLANAVWKVQSWKLSFCDSKRSTLSVNFLMTVFGIIIWLKAQFTHLHLENLLSLLIELCCSCLFLTQGDFLLAYWSAAVPSDLPRLRLILSGLFWWDSIYSLHGF